MKNIRLPDNDEWNRIVDDAFSSDEIHTFSEKYNMKKQSMRKGITMKKNNLMMNLTVAAAALAVVAFPTGIYLSTRTAETQPAAEIPAEEIKSTPEENAEKEIDYDTIYNVEYGWLPEGLEYQEQDSPYGGKFHNWTTDDGMTPKFFKVPEGVKYIEDTGNPEIETTKDEWLLDGKTVSIYHRSDYVPDNPELNFGRIAFIYFDNTPYVLKLYVTDGISEEDFKKIIDNVKLVPSDTETAKNYQPSNMTAVEVSDGVDDGVVNEKTYEYTEEDTEVNAENNMDYDAIYDLEYGWLPEGLEYKKHGPYATKFHNDITGGGMTPAFVKNNSDDDIIGLGNDFTLVDQYNQDGKTIEIYQRDDYNEELASPDNFGRIAVIYFDNTQYVLSLWVTDDITKEDLAKIIENVKLVPSDKETAQIYQQPNEETENETTEYDPYYYYFKEDECTVYQVGDEIPEYDPEEKGDISIKVNDVHFQDNFDGITTNRHNEYTDFSQYLDENGKVSDFKMEWLDENYEAVAYESLPCHVMVLNLTYTNNDDETIEYMMGPQIQHRYNGYFCPESILWEMEEVPKHPEYFSSGYNREALELRWDFTYFSISTDKYGDFENIVLEPGESTDVQLAFIVRDDLRDNLYLNINGYLPENNSKHLLDLSNIE